MNGNPPPTPGLDSSEHAWLRHRPFPDVAPVVAQALGQVLADTRIGRDMTCAGLSRAMVSPVSSQTLRNYELGSYRMRMPVERLLDVCIALNAAPPEFLERVLARTRSLIGDRPPPLGLVADADAAHTSAAMVNAAERSAVSEALRRGGIAANEVVKLRDEVARLRVALNKERGKIAAAVKRADAADAAATSLRATLAGIDAVHQDAVTELVGAHARELSALKSEHRAALAEVRTGYVVNVERVTPAEPAVSRVVSPAATPNRRLGKIKGVVRAMQVREDADPDTVRIYTTFVGDQQFTLKALALGYPTGQIANALKVPIDQVERYVTQMCRRFHETNHVGLADIGRSLFVEGKSS